MDEEILSQEELLNNIKEEQICKEDIEDTDTDIQLDESSRTLIVDKSDPTVESLYLQYQRGHLILQPKFQRNYVMKKPVASRLIESLMLNVPLPMFYFSEEKDGKSCVIDGQQRLTAIFSFIDGDFKEGVYENGKSVVKLKPFKLSGLKVLTEYNNKSFNELPQNIQNQIKDSPLRVVTIKKGSNSDLKFEIFERLNTGSTPLNEDEIRNNVYRGKLIDLLDELEENPRFNEIVAKPNFKNRMLYRGMILRFLALSERSYLNYKPSMKQFCNRFLNDFRNLNKEKETEFTQRFKDALDMVYTVFGKNAFRRFAKAVNSNDCDWIETRINMALFDIEMCGFVNYKKEQIIPHSDEIREALIDLMVNDQQFIDSIQLKTSNSDMVQYRFETWFKKLKEIIVEKPTPRLFSYAQKKELYEKDPTCAICHQHINSIDDAHVDHIIPAVKGGATIMENAQLAHRWCNLHKSDNV